MAATVTPFATVQQLAARFPYGPFTAVWYTVQLDNSYLTTGEVVTAAQVSLSAIVAGRAVYPLKNAAGTLSLHTYVVPNASGSQATIQAGYGPTSVGPLPEATSTNDLSAYTGLIEFIGYP